MMPLVHTSQKGRTHERWSQGRRARIAVSLMCLLALAGCVEGTEVSASRRSAPRPVGEVDQQRPPDIEPPDIEAPDDVFGSPEMDLEGDVPCPVGEVTAAVTSLDAVDEFDTGTWMVELTGTLVNDTDAPITGVFVDVQVPGAMGVMGFTDDFEVAAGASTTWTATTLVTEGPEPVDATAFVESFMWVDFDHFGCPTS